MFIYSFSLILSTSLRMHNPVEFSLLKMGSCSMLEISKGESHSKFKITGKYYSEEND